MRCFALLALFGALCNLAQASSELAVRGPRFVDAQGRTVILRGVNISASAKTPPFVALAEKDFNQLDPLKAWGLNVIRVLFIWEAYEPTPGDYDESYLDKIAALTDAAWARGIFTVVDMHQDSFSRYLDNGCGVGFPAWVSGHDATHLPTGKCDKMWAVTSAMSSTMHRAYGAFYNDDHHARTHFMEMWTHIAERLKTHPGVIGYDVINEPWGDEPGELVPLYTDAAWAIHNVDASAIIFVEPYVLSITGVVRSNLERPEIENLVFAPHFYDAVAIGTMHYYTNNPLTDFIYNRMPRRAHEWKTPLFVGEFGAYAETTNVEEYVDHLYELLDDNLASGAQWNYTPAWTNKTKDGWNGEDYSIVDDAGHVRRNFKPRPYPRRVSGTPLKFRVARKGGKQTVTLKWRNDPKTGVTEIYLPRQTLFGASPFVITAIGEGLSCTFAETEMLLTCASPTLGIMRVQVAAPTTSTGRSGD